MKKIGRFFQHIFFSGPVPLAPILGIILITVSVVALVVKNNPRILGLGSEGSPQQAGTVASEEEVKVLIEKVGRLVLLPDSETPTVATVTDIAQIRNQPFFQNAQNGDKVLVYTQAKKAYLYRPTIDRLIDTAPVNLGTQSAVVAGSTAPSGAPQAHTPTPALTLTPAPTGVTVSNPKVILYNGTQTTGLTRRYETELKAKVPGATVVDRDVAKKKDYTKTLIIDLSGTKKAAAQSLAQTLGIAVSDMPAGETASGSAEFLIIVGADKET